MATGKLPSLVEQADKATVEVEISTKDSLEALRQIASSAEQEKRSRRRLSRYS